MSNVTAVLQCPGCEAILEAEERPNIDWKLGTTRIVLVPEQNAIEHFFECLDFARPDLNVASSAFTLGDPEALAAMAIAAGIKPGQDLTTFLSLITATSKLAKADEGTIAETLLKVAATGKLTTDSLFQIIDVHGLPILQGLSNVLEVSEEEVHKLASAGEINFADLQTAMEISVGGATEAETSAEEPAVPTVEPTEKVEEPAPADTKPAPKRRTSK